MTRRVSVDALENRDGLAATGDVFEFDDAHANGGTWQAPGAGSAAAAWPVGSIFFSAVSTNPATLLGFGTWSAIGAGRVLIGIDAGDVDFDTLGETGGAKTSAHAHGPGTLSTSSGSPHSHGPGTLVPSVHTATTVGNHAVTQPNNHAVTQPSSHSPHGHDNGTLALNDHTGTQLSHVHNFTTGSTTGSGNIGDKVGTGVSITGTTGDNGPPTVTHTFSGTIAASATLTHSGTAVDPHSGTAVDAHAVTGPGNHTMGGDTAAEDSHTHTVNTGSTGSDSPSVVQPYLVVAMWQRTA